MLKLSSMQDTLYSEISTALAKEPQVIAVYVIGSTVSGNSTSGSDFDLAVIVKNRTKVSDDRIYDLLQDISFPRNLDLSVVDKSFSPLFLFQIISKGKRIYEKSDKSAADFESFVMHNYYDTQHIRNIYFGGLANKFNYVH